MGDGDPWLLLDSGACDFAWNMGADEALLEMAPTVGMPVLRFYGWLQAAASFGYFQHIQEIEAVTELRPLVRRPTGGGLVPHDRDWTYSVVVPPSHPWYALRASASYERVHVWIREAFALLGVVTELAPCCRKEIAGQCFAGYEQFDLLWLGRKIAGAAQRRTKTGLLIQGSVQPQPPGVTREGWQLAMSTAASSQWQLSWERSPMPVGVARRAEELRAEKYAVDTYNRRR